MYLIPVFVIIISMGVMGFVVVKHASVLANLSINSIAREREKKFKDEIVSNRLKRGIKGWFFGVYGAFKPFIKKGVEFIDSVKHGMNESKIKNSVNSKVNNVSGDVTEVEGMFKEVEELIKDEKFDECEKKLIAIIEIDHKNLDAFAMLGQVYFEKKNYDEAKQTLEHVIKLGGEHDETFFDLAVICRTIGDMDQALVYVEKSVDMNENNPRFLDLYLEMLIEQKSKKRAGEVYEKLKSSNSGNAKLEQLKRSIDNLI